MHDTVVCQEISLIQTHASYVAAFQTETTEHSTRQLPSFNDHTIVVFHLHYLLLTQALLGKVLNTVVNLWNAITTLLLLLLLF